MLLLMRLYSWYLPLLVEHSSIRIVISDTVAKNGFMSRLQPNRMQGVLFCYPCEKVSKSSDYLNVLTKKLTRTKKPPKVVDTDFVV